MIGTFLVLSHFLLRRLGIAPVNQSMGCDSICLSHEGGARPPGSHGGPALTARQPGGTDEPPTSASGRSLGGDSRTDGPCTLGLGTTTGLETHEANAVTAFDFRPLVDTSEAIPLIGFDFETIVDPRSMSLADIGSGECEYLDEDDAICQELYPVSIISKGGGGMFQGFQPVSCSEDNISVDTTKSNVQEVVESQDLPASGDGTKTPVDVILTQEQGKEVPANGLDEVIAAILGLDEVKVGDSERNQNLKTDLTSPIDETFEKVKSCMKNAVSKGEPDELAMNECERRPPKMVIDVPTQETVCSDQENLLYLDKCLKNAF